MCQEVWILIRRSAKRRAKLSYLADERNMLKQELCRPTSLACVPAAQAIKYRSLIACAATTVTANANPDPRTTPRRVHIRLTAGVSLALDVGNMNP